MVSLPMCELAVTIEAPVESCHTTAGHLEPDCVREMSRHTPVRD